MTGMNAVQKAVELLRVLDEHGASGLGVSELARRSGIPKSTVFRLLRTLETEDVLERVGERYRMGRLLNHELALPDSPDIERVQVVVTPFLASLYERSRHTVQLAVLDGTHICFLNKLFGLHRVGSPSRIGGRAPAYCTSLGKVLAAFTPGAPEAIAADEMVAWTARTQTDPDGFLAEVAVARKSRIGLDDAEYIEGVRSIASVVTAGDGTAVASLCITGPRAEITHAAHHAMVLDVCARATAAYRRAMA